MCGKPFPWISEVWQQCVSKWKYRVFFQDSQQLLKSLKIICIAIYLLDGQHILLGRGPHWVSGTTDMFIYLIFKTTLIDLMITPILQMGKRRFRKVKNNSNNKHLPQTIKYRVKVLGTNVVLGRYRSPLSFHSCGFLASYLVVLNESFLYSFPSGLRPTPPRERSSFLPNTRFASGWWGQTSERRTRREQEELSLKAHGWAPEAQRRLLCLHLKQLIAVPWCKTVIQHPQALGIPHYPELSP